MPRPLRGICAALLLLLAGIPARADKYAEVPEINPAFEVPVVPNISVAAPNAINPSVVAAPSAWVPPVAPTALTPSQLPQGASQPGKLESSALPSDGLSSQSNPLSQPNQDPKSGIGPISVPRTIVNVYGVEVPADQPDEAAGKLEELFNGGTQHGNAALPSEAAPVQVPETQPASNAAEKLSAATNGRSGRELLMLLHGIVAEGYKGHGWDSAREYMFGTADNVVVNGQHGVYDVYTLAFVPGNGRHGGDYIEKDPRASFKRGGKRGEPMNVEHVWPKFYFSERAPMLTDLHHLFPTTNPPNSNRSRSPFAEIQNKGDVTYSNTAGAKATVSEFEPPDASKGKIARAVLYFYVRYFDQGITDHDFSRRFWENDLEMFLRWNRQHPPDDQERHRNDLIEKFQGNRNPFVDDPALADRIGAEALQRNTASTVNRNSISSIARFTSYPSSNNYRGNKKKKKKHRRW